LAETILHCDVLINGISTTTIEAAIFDKPCICLGYDGDPAHNSTVPLYFKNSHYEKVVRTNGFRIAWNEEDLVRQINLYLEHPELDREGRELIRRQQCYRLDGQSGKRIAEFLMNRIGS
jgi:CDP-glycerol glycerophosphotransferase (TagB/SpsB family)